MPVCKIQKPVTVSEKPFTPWERGHPARKMAGNMVAFPGKCKEAERNRSHPPWERGLPAQQNRGQDGRAPRKRQGGVNGFG